MLTRAPALPVAFNVKSSAAARVAARGRYAIGRPRHWDEKTLEPEEAQENAQVLLLEFDPGGEFAEMWELCYGRDA